MNGSSAFRIIFLQKNGYNANTFLNPTNEPAERVLRIENQHAPGSEVSLEEIRRAVICRPRHCGTPEKISDSTVTFSGRFSKLARTWFFQERFEQY